MKSSLGLICVVVLAKVMWDGSSNITSLLGLRMPHTLLDQL